MGVRERVRAEGGGIDRVLSGAKWSKVEQHPEEAFGTVCPWAAVGIIFLHWFMELGSSPADAHRCHSCLSANLVISSFP